MTAMQTTATDRRLPVRLVAGLITVAFAVSAAAGLIVSQAAVGSDAVPGAPPEVEGAAGGAEDIGRDGVAPVVDIIIDRSLAGVAENNMSDAVLNYQVALDRSRAGVAENNMSDAVLDYQVALDRSRAGVAQNNMSDSVRDYLNSPDQTR